MKKLKRNIEKFLVYLLPSSFCSLLGFIYGYLQPAKKSYSQYGEDIILLNYFKHNNITNGFYIDIGAYHPKFISNTFLLHQNGWSGICVDIDHNKLNWFKLVRGKSISTILSAVSSSTQDEINIYKHKRLFSEIDTLDINTAKNNKLLHGWDFDTVHVPAININDILSQCNGNDIDLLNIDVEGLDTDIIMHINFSIYKPRVIIFEDNNNFGGSVMLRNILTQNGYSLLFISMGSTGYYLTT